MNNIIPVLLSVFSVLFTGCASVDHYVSKENSGWDKIQKPSEDKLAYRLILIGDTGAPMTDKPDPVLDLLNNLIDHTGSNSMVGFLGDNLYPNGLPDPESRLREQSEKRLEVQLEVVKDSRGHLVFIPGNHDWGPDNVKSLEVLSRQERFIEDYLQRGNTFLPDSGFPGPVTRKLLEADHYSDIDRDLRLVAIDTEWWFRKKVRPLGNSGDYVLENEVDFIKQLQDTLSLYKDDRLIVLGHHPLFSNGNHGGKFPLKTHLLPPVFGSFYVLYRKIFGLEQDLTRRHYEKLRYYLTDLFDERDDLIYASGHEHNLQYFMKKAGNKEQHYLVSGSGSLTDYVRGGNGIGFASNQKGFMVLDYYVDGSTWLEVWSPDTHSGNKEGTILFRKKLE